MNEFKALSEEKVNYGQTRGVTSSEMGGRLLQEFCVKKVQLFEKRNALEMTITLIAFLQNMDI